MSDETIQINLDGDSIEVLRDDLVAAITEDMTPVERLNWLSELAWDEGRWHSDKPDIANVVARLAFAASGFLRTAAIILSGDTTTYALEKIGNAMAQLNHARLWLRMWHPRWLTGDTDNAFKLDDKYEYKED